MSELITLDQNDIPALLSDAEKMEVVIVQIEKAALSEVSDTSTKPGRAAITSLAYKVAKTKGPLKKAADDLKEDAQAIIKSVNGGKNTFDDRMDTLRDKIKQPLIDWQEAEDKRVADLEAKLKTEFQFEPGATTSDIAYQIECVKSVSVEQADWSEFAGAAQVAKKQMLETLRDKLELARVREAAEAEAEANRKELEELRAKQAEADKVREAAEAKAEEERQAEYRKVEAARQVEAEIAQKARDKELADLRAEQAEKDEAAAAERSEAELVRREETKRAEDAHEKIRAEMAEQQAVKDKVAAARQAEGDKIAANLRAENEQMQAEQKRRDEVEAKAALAAQVAAEAKAEKKRVAAIKANDAKLIAAGRNEAIKAFYDADMTEAEATEIVDLIIDGIIPHIRFVPGT